MFNKQKEECKCEPVNCFEDKVKCETCKCWVDKEDAQRQRMIGFMGYVSYYYCQAHKMPYDRMINALPENLYFKEVRVDKDGEPYGYIKIKEKQNDNTRTKN